MRTKGDRNRLVQMLMNDDATAGERGAQLTALELPGLVGEAHGVIARHDALVLQRKDQVEILASEGHESSAALIGRLAETLIELRDVLRAQEAVGFLQGGD